MNPLTKPYVQIGIKAVDTVVYDPSDCYDADRHDRYATFSEARDAALTSIEIMLDEEDYNGDDHRNELELMLCLLEAARSFEDLAGHPDYLRFLERLVSAVPAPA